MRNFSRDIMEYTKPEDFRESEWFEVDEDRGLARRHRVYTVSYTHLDVYKRQILETVWESRWLPD